MTPKIGYKGPQLPPLPSAPKKPMSGNVDTTGAQKMIAAKTAQRNQKAAGFTPQFSPEVKKGIQAIIDPTGANVGRQAVPMRRSPMMKKGGSVSSASKRADGIAKQGKTKGKIC
jgi:hypothetical protein